MSRILYLCHRLPFPPDKGCRIRAFHQLQGLAQRHEVHVLALAEGRQEMRQASGLRDFCTSVEVFRLDRRRALVRTAATAWRPRPLTLSFFDSRELRQRVTELTRFPGSGGGFDAAFFLGGKPETFEKIASGEQNATTAYMTGKLKIKGDMGAAMKLQKIF